MAECLHDFPGRCRQPVEVFLRGLYNDPTFPSSCYIDTVRMSVVYETQSTVRAIARDLKARRHVLATQEAAWAVAGQSVERMGELPSEADHIAAAGDFVVVASGTALAVSGDGGQTWLEEEQPAAVEGLAAVVARMLDPDQRIQEVIRLIFARFQDIGTVRQVLLSMADQGVHFPKPSDGVRLTSFAWRVVLPPFHRTLRRLRFELR